VPNRIVPVPIGKPSFADVPRCADLDTLEAGIAIIGVPYGVPYTMETSRNPSSEAPAAIREESLRYGKYFTHHDVDLGGTLLDGREIRIVDCGDVAMTPGDLAGNSATTTDVIRTIRDRGAVPIVLGGDHSIPIPVMRAYDAIGSMCVVQVDAHLDFRDEVNGIREGLSSPIRRASEHAWVGDIVQIGLRGVGSARPEDIAAAQAHGTTIIPARDVHRDGIQAVLDRIPGADNYYITFDMDGVDFAIAPGVTSTAFGGLDYWQATDLLQGVAGKGHVVGFDMVEIVPRLDTRGMTSNLAARLILNLIGAMARSGQFD
jgi:agmatinase